MEALLEALLEAEGERLEISRTKEERWRLYWRLMANKRRLRANRRKLVATEGGSWLEVAG